MKNLENGKALNEVEMKAVAGGGSGLTFYSPSSQPAPAEPETPEPGPMGRQATFEENQQAALNLHLNWGR